LVKRRGKEIEEKRCSIGIKGGDARFLYGMQSFLSPGSSFFAAFQEKKWKSS